MAGKCVAPDQAGQLLWCLCLRMAVFFLFERVTHNGSQAFDPISL